MAINVVVTKKTVGKLKKGEKAESETYRGEQFKVDSASRLGFLFTEYHEAAPGGLVDLAQGTIIPIGDDVKDIQVIKV